MENKHEQVRSLVNEIIHKKEMRKNKKIHIWSIFKPWTWFKGSSYFDNSTGPGRYYPPSGYTPTEDLTNSQPPSDSGTV